MVFECQHLQWECRRVLTLAFFAALQTVYWQEQARQSEAMVLVRGEQLRQLQAQLDAARAELGAAAASQATLQLQVGMWRAEQCSSSAAAALHVPALSLCCPRRFANNALWTPLLPFSMHPLQVEELGAEKARLETHLEALESAAAAESANLVSCLPRGLAACGGQALPLHALAFSMRSWPCLLGHGPRGTCTDATLL